MHHITFVSTIHQEIGKCNADELCKLMVQLSPDVIFLEAVDKTYSAYEKYLFSTYGVFHNKLEISAIQKYSYHISFEYVPVCENALTDAFLRKINIVCQNSELQKRIDNFNVLAATQGFPFLNSLECIELQDEMRMLESRILKDSDLDKIVNADIDAYENPMIKNIYSYCRDNDFESAIFMCGAAHRKSIIEKLRNYNAQEEVKMNWKIL